MQHLGLIFGRQAIRWDELKNHKAYLLHNTTKFSQIILRYCCNTGRKSSRQSHFVNNKKRMYLRKIC